LLACVISQQHKESLDLIIQVLDADVSQEMDYQSHETEQSGVVNCQPKPISHLCHKEISVIRPQRAEGKEQKKIEYYLK